MSKQTKPTTQHEVEELKILLDQKNRELEIEAALERIRAGMMAMQKSEEFPRVIDVLYCEIRKLGFSYTTTDLELTIVNEDESTMTVWSSNDNFSSPKSRNSKIELDNISVLDRQYDQWRKLSPTNRKGLVLAFKSEGNEWKDMLESLKSHPDWGPAVKVFYENNINEWHWLHAYNKYGSIILNGGQKIPKSTLPLLRRFSEVFEQTYTRFLDLQKAEAQAREAQIDAALERVRNRALLMRDSCELNEVVGVFFKEFQQLNLLPPETRTYFCDINTTTHVAEVWMTYSNGEVMSGSHFTPLTKSASMRKYYESWKKKEPINVRAYTGKNLDMYLSFVSTLPHVKKDKDYKKLFRNPPKKIYMTDANFLQGNIGMMTFEPPSKESLDVLVRFAKVFEFTYTRFLDLQKAEAQAREAQIEAALERVRSRSMAMHKSDELQEVINQLFVEIESLGVQMGSSYIVTDVDEDIAKGVHIWLQNNVNLYAERVHLPYLDHPMFHKFYKAWWNKTPLYTEIFNKKEKNRLFNHLFKESPQLSAIPEERKKHVLDGSGFTRSVVIFKNVAFVIQKYDDIPFKEEEINIQKRFGGVFEQTFTRFLDLQKAEAQVREAQIEAALERVRAASMAMHRSEELVEVATILYGELRNLEISEFSDASIVIVEEKNNRQIVWGARTESDYMEKAILPLLGDHVLQRLYDKWRQKEAFFTLKIRGNELENHLNFVFPKGNRTEIEDLVIKGMPDPTFFHCASFATGYLELVADKELSKDSNFVLTRFARVFEQTYTRFLDLQKAEAQAREAQIEAALEKVRSRSLAMHKPDELKEVVTVVVEKLMELGVVLDANGVVLCTYFKDSKDVLHWIASPDFSFVGSYLLPYFDHPIFKSAWHSKESGDEYFSKSFSVEEKNSFFEHAFKHSDYKYFPDEYKRWIFQNDKHSLSFAWSKNSAILIPSNTGILPSESEQEILKRFSKVFEQAYIRFLDLQKAEAQAREGEIELGLERVRSRAMAMHKSEELSEVVALVYKQIQGLGFSDWGCSIIICDEDARIMRYWYAEINLQYLPGFCNVPLTNKIVKKVWKLWKSTVPQFDISLLGKEKESYTSFMLTDTDYHDILPEEVKEEWRKPKDIFLSYFTFKYGMLEFVDIKPLNSENYSVYERFAKVFEQTYTRFLDLQKAEAQAREAQIEVALERVRASSMAMHKSDELKQVVAEMYKQLEGFDLSRIGCELILCDEELDQLQFWSSSIEQSMLPERYDIPESVHPFFKKIWNAWKLKQPNLTITLEGKEKRDFDSLIFSKTDFRKFPAKVKKYISSRKSDVFTFATMKYGLLEAVDDERLSEDKIRILERFAKVFEQTYTRFLDLQKAEAQAREAQIEVALERVRASSMAMHQSEELNNVLSTMFAELTNLDFALARCVIWIFEKEDKSFTWYSANPEGEVESYLIPFTNYKVVTDYWDFWEKRIRRKYYDLSGGLKKGMDEYIFNHTEMVNMPKEVIRGMTDPKQVHLYNTFNDFGALLISSIKHQDDEIYEILERFGNVFNQAFTRFKDIQRAEAQTREAKIEAALERVRAKAMAMHHTEDLGVTIEVFYEQLAILLATPIVRCGAGILNKENFMAEIATASKNEKGLVFNVMGIIDMTGHPLLKNTIDHWLDQKEYYHVLKGAEIKQYYQYMTNQVAIPDYSEDEEQHFYFPMFSEGSFYIIVKNQLPSEELAVVRRFSSVLSLTYRRFNDLKKAEAQAREAEIQLALERVRARTMAMHKSEELAETASVLFQQFHAADVNPERINIGIVKEEEGLIEFWSTEQGGKRIDKVFKAEINEPSTISKIYTAWKAGKKTLVLEQSGKVLKDWLAYLKEEIGMPFKEELFHEKRYQSVAFFSKGMILISSPERLSEETMQLMPRFANVFEQTYTRFLDLQKAEAQAREAQIEASLERIRAKALAMQSSADLHDVSMVLREEMGILGQQDLESSIVHLYNNATTLESWYTFRSTETHSTKVVTDVAFIPVNSCDYIKETIEKYKSKETEYTIVSKGKKLLDWYNVMVKVAPDTIEYDDKGKMLVPEILYYHHSKFSGGALLMISNQPPSDESKELQRRAAKVFNLAYQRFLDLKMAESQAREAQIEAALERVRGKAMSMQHSDDLSQSVATTLDELEKLELHIQRCGVGIFNHENKTAELWTTTHTDDGKKVIILGELPLMTHPMMKGSYKAWLKKQGYSYILEGDDLRAYYNMLSEEGFALPAENILKAKTIERQYYNYYTFPAGGLYVFSGETISAEEGKIVQRFADVFHLAFTRYIDLQNAEARAVEAVKQASLDRVRAEIASMRTAHDLQRITPLIWSELTNLGVPFIRCGVFIMDDVNSLMQSYLSTPDGKSLGIYDLPYESTEIAKKLVQRWKSKKAYKEHWDKDQFLKFMETMAKRGLIQNQQKYQGDSKPPESLDLHFVPFKQGMIYAGNVSPLREDELFLVKSLAEAFSIAYARYEDFTQLEQAKNQIENTLGELKSTQTQLIHAEKMASLGELTAGIAHEIQNPLNFVNNFSEVSKELIEEMNEEMDIGNLKEVKEITNDLKQNLDKIHHHGQRASSIVKGMLEHSRAGNREKELTDINQLADEYLRLSYHGLRAKDKSFNADFKLELDEDLPKISVIGQEIGRVLLNLINNAFYAVSERAKKQADRQADELGDSKKVQYVPTVIVKTKKIDKFIEIRVRDNGDGIPSHVIDKIFQPFFTTKPTGQGTGLGLSLSYDIITKGHNGSMDVDTNEGLGTEFIIHLP